MPEGSGATHFSNLQAKRIVTQGGQPVASSVGNPPEQPTVGDFFWDAQANRMAVYNNGQWWYAQFTTTTSTSTSTTSTSTSTTSTSSSTSSSTSTSLTTSTSTTTTF